MTEFVKIRGSYYQLDHVIAVKRIKAFRDLSGKAIQYVVRVSSEAAGGDDDRFRNLWCTKAEVESFLRKMKGLPEAAEDDKEDETPDQVPEEVSIGAPDGLR